MDRRIFREETSSFSGELLFTPLVYDKTDNDTANCAKHQDWRIRLRDNRIRQTQEHAEDKTIEPRRNREPGGAEDKSDRKTIQESAQQCSSLVAKLQRNHRSCQQRAPDKTADRSKCEF